VRSKAKIEATIDNAQALLELAAEYGGFARYPVSHGGFEATVADLKRQFRFIGDSGACQFLYAIDQPVPPHDEWLAATRRPRRRRRDARSDEPRDDQRRLTQEARWLFSRAVRSLVGQSTRSST
jgi:hypothetical protein